MMEYLRQVADANELGAKVAEWQRKVGIASPPGALKRATTGG